MTVRHVQRIVRAQPTREGAGVHLRRAFGFGETADFDPFLLLDDFRNDDPAKYRAGFPSHPHRGMETITYVLAGSVEHQDSLGNRGVISAGDVQWMTAGRGIIHQEMPKGDADGRMEGFQLWANLPAASKMTAPRYQEVKSAEIPEVEDGGARVRVVCGDFRGTKGPVSGVAAKPTYLDVSLAPGARTSIPIDAEHRAFAYVFGGAGRFGGADRAAEADDRTLVLFEGGGDVAVEAGGRGARFLLVAGKPLREPVAWYGPVVMNTQEELQRAFADLQRGTFLTP